MGARLAICALVSAFVLVVAPGSTLAADGHIKLALTPVGQSESYFDLTMRPGETRNLEVDIGNVGDDALVARTYAADVYTIINGGFGGRLRDESRTGTTRWLSYPTDVLEVSAGMWTRRSFSVSVPEDTEPGEYITSLVLENDEPIRGDGEVAVNQIVRQAVAVVVTVPGQRSPALAIGEATHRILAGNSIVAVAVENSGNVRLKPMVTFALFDAAGAQVSQTSVPMDTFYAHTSTFVEVQLAALLLPGTYTVALTLDDAILGARADESAIVLVVAADAEAIEVDGVTPGLIEVVQDSRDGQLPLAVWAAVLVASLLFAAGLTLVLRRVRSA